MTLEWPQRLGMEHPEAAAKVEVEAGLVEVVSIRQKRRDRIIWLESGCLCTSWGWKCDKNSASLSIGAQSREPMGELKYWQEHKKVLF